MELAVFAPGTWVSLEEHQDQMLARCNTEPSASYSHGDPNEQTNTM
jgi:hypothetical protein